VTLLPDPEIVPALAPQLTAVFELPETVAVKLCDPPAEILALPGEIATETVPPPPDGEDEGPLLPQLDDKAKTAVIAAARKIRWSCPRSE